MLPYKHLSYTDRLRIEKLLKERLGVCEIARILRVHRNTITRELKRGFYERLDGDTWKMLPAYSPDIAEQRYQENLRSKGPALKIGSDRRLADKLEELMSGNKDKKKRFAPAAAIAQARREGFTVPFSKVTLYSYIEKGVFLKLSSKDLIMKESKRRRYHKVRARRAPAGESIEKRPTAINQRLEAGHWEMDSVIGRQGKGPCLITLTERKSLFELAFLVPDHSAGSVVRILDRIEKAIGPDRFKRTFKSITVDNGTEFSLCQELEKSFFSSEKRTKLYYCHPYSSYERGRNENQNRMLRRFFPKGISLEGVTQNEVEEACAFINHYPRESLGWKSSSELFCLSVA